MKKIKKSHLKALVKEAVKKNLQLQEKSDFSDDFGLEDVVDYSQRVDKFLKETIEKARKLHDEGEELIKSNILSSYKIQERNRFLLYNVGFLNNLMASLLARLEDKYRQGA